MAGVADLADRMAGRDRAPGGDARGEALQMSVARDHAVGVLDVDDLAVGEVDPGVARGGASGGVDGEPSVAIMSRPVGPCKKPREIYVSPAAGLPIPPQKDCAWAVNGRRVNSVRSSARIGAVNGREVNRPLTGARFVRDGRDSHDFGGQWAVRSGGHSY
jgi:hypothetical protein